MAMVMYGIANCDTVKKARAWLDTRGLAYTFHDYKKLGADPAQVRRWIDRAGLDAVLNRGGTTFRKLPEADKVAIDAERAVALMVAQPSMIRRPVLEVGERLMVGFKPNEYQAVFNDL